MKNMMILVWQRFQHSKVTAAFFVIGYAVSMLLISINTSFVFQHLDAANLKKKFTPPNGTLYTVSDVGDKTDITYVTKQDIVNLFQGIRPDTGVIFNGLETRADKSTDVHGGYCSLNAEYYTEDSGWHYPLKEGRYYTVEEMAAGEKVALIGSSLEDCVEQKDGKEIISLGGTEYEVIGRVGNENGMSLWENYAFVPYSAIPEDAKSFLAWGSLTFTLYNERGALKEDIKLIRENGKKLKSGFELEKVGKLQVEDMVSTLLENVDGLYIMAVLGYLATLIYAVNIIMYWLQKMRFEIGLRKACGYTNGRIFRMLYEEILGMCLIACVLAFVVQKLAGVLLHTTGYEAIRFSLSVWNLLIALAITVISTFIILILPSRKLAKIRPVEILRGE